jgi:hypothetical protein
MADNIALLLSAVLGAMAGGMISLIVEYRKRRMETVSLANAFYGEIKALLSKVEKRDYIPMLLAAAKQKKFIAIEAKQNYFEVYENNCDRIGMLPPHLTYEITKFYIFAKAFVDDANAYCDSDDPRQSHHKQYKMMADLLEDIGEAGQSVIRNVESMNRHANVRLIRARYRRRKEGAAS